MSEPVTMRIAAGIFWAIAAFCPFAWYVYYRRVAASRVPGTEWAPTRRGIQKQFLVVGGFSSLCFLAWGVFWYTLSLIATGDAISALAWLIVNLLCLAVLVCAQFMTIYALSRLRRVLQTIAPAND